MEIRRVPRRQPEAAVVADPDPLMTSGPLGIVDGVITPYNWPYQWATGAITPIS